MAPVRYEEDVVLWAKEQAEWVRKKQFEFLDTQWIAEEIEEVGKSEQRELASRMALLLSHLLKWHYQPAYRCTSWKATIKTQRERVKRRLKRTPSLQNCLEDDEWWADAWDDARDIASKETGMAYDTFPEERAWTTESVLSNDWFPESPTLPYAAKHF